MNKKALLDLYERKKLSMTETAHNLEVTQAKIYYWLKKYGIERRTWSESAYVKQNPNGDPFKIKKVFDEREKQLLAAGLMLYWAEGNKKNKQVVQLANLDHRMLRVFINFIRQICGVDENKIVLYVRVYGKFNQDRVQSYWSKLLGVLRERVRVYSHGDRRSKVDKQWSEFGIATLQINNIKLKKWLDNQIDIYLKQFV